MLANRHLLNLGLLGFGGVSCIVSAKIVTKKRPFIKGRFFWSRW
jgi:hypothetical protein